VKQFHGEVYLETGLATSREERLDPSAACSFKKLRYGWLVYQVSTGRMIGVVATRESARFVASVISGREERVSAKGGSK
jgi:hypothetical protein